MFGNASISSPRIRLSAPDMAPRSINCNPHGCCSCAGKGSLQECLRKCKTLEQPFALSASVSFVTDDFVRELKTAPFWSGPELIRRAAPGDFPILRDKQLRNANAQDGLNLLVWEGCIHPDFINDAEVPRFMIDVFIEAHQRRSSGHGRLHARKRKKAPSACLCP